jgi:hypothetical protein
MTAPRQFYEGSITGLPLGEGPSLRSCVRKGVAIWRIQEPKLSADLAVWVRYAMADRLLLGQAGHVLYEKVFCLCSAAFDDRIFTEWLAKVRNT